MFLNDIKTNNIFSNKTINQSASKNASSFPAQSIIQREIASSINTTQIQRDEIEDVQPTQTGGINVRYPSAPVNDHIQSSSGISNTYSNSWSPFIENNRLTFGFEYTGSDAVTISVVLTDDAGNGYLSQGSVHWDGNSEGGTQYIEFSGFPTKPDGSVMGSCNSESIMRNDSSESTGVHGYEKIYLG